MTKALPRRFRDNDGEARSSARAEARRSGKRLGAWLDDAARDVEDDYEDDADAEDRVEAIARRLARSGDAEARRQRDDDEPPRRWRDDAKGQQARRRREEADEPPRRRREETRARRENDDIEEQPRRWREDIDEAPRRWRDEAEDIPRRRRAEADEDQPRRRRERDERPPRRRDEEDQPRRWRDEAEEMRAAPRRRREALDIREGDDLNRPASSPRRARKPAIDPKAIVADAAAIVGRRLAESERQTARALDNLVELVEDGARGRESADEGLAFLARRLGRIESRLKAQPSAGDSVRPIRTALTRLENRLERLSGPERVAHVEEALDGLDRRLADIARRLETPAPRERAPAAQAEQAGGTGGMRSEPAPRAEPAARRPLDDAAAEAAPRRPRAFEAYDPSVAAQPAAPAFEPIAAPPPEPAFAPAAARPPAPAPAFTPPAPAPHAEAEVLLPARQLAAVQATLESISSRLESVRHDAAARGDQHLVVMRQVEGLRRDLLEMSGAIVELAPRASVAAIEAALLDLSRRIEAQRDRGVAEDLLAPAQRIARELRHVMKELDPSPLVRNLHADVQAIGRRLDALSRPGTVDSATVEQLVGQTRDIRAQLAALAARPLPLEKIETRLVDLTQRVDLLARAGGGAAKAAVAFDMGELARSIRAIVAEETSASFDTFSGRLETLATRLDGVVNDAGGKRFDELGKRIDDLGSMLSTRLSATGAQAPVDASPLESLVAGLARKIDAALEHKPHTPAIEEIGRKLDALQTRLPDQRLGFEELGRKLDALETRLPDSRSGIEEIGKRIKRIENRLPDALAVESIARLEAALAERPAERHFADLAERIEGVRETLTQKIVDGAVVPGPDVGQIERLVRGLDSKVESALSAGARVSDMEPIRDQLEQLSRKVDRLEDPGANPRLGALLARPAEHPKLDEIVARLDHMQNSLARAADDGVRVEARQAELTDLVEQLAARMNQAAGPAGDAEALRALEQQIGALSKRLDRNDQNGAALAAVEEKIGALVAQIEETKTATALAAEEAIRRATQDILRDAAPDPAALRAAIERELADIRHIQDESGQRTHETLLAVHETLERVVDRLAVFEDELTEIRTASPAATPSSPPVAPRRAESTRPQVPAPAAAEPRLSARSGMDISDDLSDLLAPGVQPPDRRDAAPALAPAAAQERARPEPAQMDFIAAARRAAQQAARDADTAQKAHQIRRSARADAPAEGEARPAAGKSAGGLAALIQERKRPLLLGLGAVVLMVGAYQIARVGIDGAESWRQGHQHAEATPNDGDEGPAAPAARVDQKATPRAISPSAPDAGKAEPAPRVIAPQGTSQPVDKTPVGSVGAGGLNPLQASQDIVPAIRALAEQGDPAAQFELAVRLGEGRGLPRDQRAAAQWFEKAAAQGLAPAQYRLGSLYEKGVGVERDHARARKFYLSAAEAGNARAMHNLAVMLAEGAEGGRPDYAAASEWFRRAGEVGVRDSQYNLAILYARGLGVSQNLVQSYLWFAAAAAQGDADADKKREEVGARLDSKELAAAKAAVAAFRVREPLRDANEVAPPAGGWENVRLPAPAPRPAPKQKISTI